MAKSNSFKMPSVPRNMLEPVQVQKYFDIFILVKW